MFCSAPVSFFRGKSVIVADCANEIGREIARLFAELGANVTIAGSRADSLRRAKEACIEAGANAENIHEVVADFDSDETSKIIVDEAINTFGAIDVLINNASKSDSIDGNSIENVSTKDIDDDSISFILEMINLCSPHLKKTKGAIVNVSSVASISFETQDICNAISTSPFDMLTVQSAARFIQKGIRVNSVNYGLSEAGIERKKGLPKELEGELRYLGRNMCMIPLKRAGEPVDIAKLIVFLSDGSQSKSVAGQRFVVD